MLLRRYIQGWTRKCELETLWATPSHRIASPRIRGITSERYTLCAPMPAGKAFRSGTYRDGRESVNWRRSGRLLLTGSHRPESGVSPPKDTRCALQCLRGKPSDLVHTGMDEKV